MLKAIQLLSGTRVMDHLCRHRHSAQFVDSQETKLHRQANVTEFCQFSTFEMSFEMNNKQQFVIKCKSSVLC